MVFTQNGFLLDLEKLNVIFQKKGIFKRLIDKWANKSLSQNIMNMPKEAESSKTKENI